MFASGSESRTTNDIQPSSAQMPTNTPQLSTVSEKVADEPKTDKITERTIFATVTDINNNNNEESGTPILS